MINVIRIKNASFYAYHGVLDEEQTIGGKFDIDLDMYTNFMDAAREDDLLKTVNYDAVYKYVNKIVSENKFKLIETLAAKVADSVMGKFNTIEKIAVKVRKNSVPVGGLLDYVEVEVVKQRDE